jgi:hypothetical protein
VAQRAIIYQENQVSPNEPTVIPAQVVWHIDSLTGRDPVVVATVEAMSVGLSLVMAVRRNADATLAASHVIELTFHTPNDPSWVVRDIGLPRFKDEEGVSGTPLAGTIMPLKDNAFLVRLSNVPGHFEQNESLLLKQNWIDLPIRVVSGRRAIVAFEKGMPGDRALSQAFKEWWNAVPALSTFR